MRYRLLHNAYKLHLATDFRVYLDEDIDTKDKVISCFPEGLFHSVLPVDFSRLEIFLDNAIMKVADRRRHENTNILIKEVLPFEPKKRLNLITRMNNAAKVLMICREHYKGRGSIINEARKLPCLQKTIVPLINLAQIHNLGLLKALNSVIVVIYDLDQKHTVPEVELHIIRKQSDNFIRCILYSP